MPDKQLQRLGFQKSSFLKPLLPQSFLREGSKPGRAKTAQRGGLACKSPILRKPDAPTPCFTYKYLNLVQNPPFTGSLPSSDSLDYSRRCHCRDRRERG